MSWPCLQHPPDGWGGVVLLGDVRWATWWVTSAVFSPVILLLLSCSCHAAGNETVWQNMCQLMFFWGQDHRAFGKEVLWHGHGQVSFPGGLSSNPHLDLMNIQTLGQMNMPRAEMELQQPSLTWCRCVVWWLAALSAKAGLPLQTGVRFLYSMGAWSIITAKNAAVSPPESCCAPFSLVAWGGLEWRSL